MEKMFGLMIVIAKLICQLVDADPTAVVMTTAGPVQGEILLTAPNSMPYAAFKGIKYGKAPIGYLRFKPPLPVDPWTETLNATVEGAPCPQIDLSSLKNVIGSEDCLFLNVFTPVTNLDTSPTTLKSVMVWIHGGGFMFGSGSTEIMKPDYLLEKDVLFVSMNYRLGVLGFLTLNHPNATGNAGLKDQVLVLKWIKANIEKFGGNPKNVTIIGHSAGGACAGYHVISKASAGLFQATITMSGSPFYERIYNKLPRALKLARQLAREMGTVSFNKEIILDTFYKATANELIIAAVPMGLFVVFGGTTENANIAIEPFITESPHRIYQTGNYNKVPHIMGFTDQETITFSGDPLMFWEILNLGSDQARDIDAKLPESFTTTDESIVDGKNFNQIDRNIVQNVINFTSNLIFIVGIDRMQRIIVTDNDNHPLYYYHISFYTNRSLHNLENPDTMLGAGHGDDLAYMFYIPTANYSTDPNDPVARMISRITTMWTNFAKFGNPTPDWIEENSVEVSWPDSGLCGKALDIGHELIVVSRPTNEEIGLLELKSSLVDAEMD